MDVSNINHFHPTDDSDSGGSSAPSPPSSPPAAGGMREDMFDGENFLRTNFESLSADKMEGFLSCQQHPTPLDVRLSISARFFSEGTK